MKIVIVGGGTAGWIAALMLTKICKDAHNISLIESEKIKTIGVGEGSTGFLRGIINNELWNYGCNEIDFMKCTNATPKLGVLFKDWKTVGSQYMEPLDVPEGKFLSSVPLLTLYASDGTDPSLSSVDGILINQKLSPFFIEDNYLAHNYRHAHHFDAKLAAEYFEKIVGNSVEKINGDIVDFNMDENGNVTKLLLEGGIEISGDFFIDASGFSRIFKDKMNVKFTEFKEMTLNSAIPFRLDVDQYSNINFYTVAWAQKYGWMWMIPKLDNIGCGYIYDDNYIDEDGAKKEIEGVLKTDIDVIKKISFAAGKLENPWNKNVLSVGLSYQFLEPLEATSIHATIAQLNTFIFFYLKNNFQRTVDQKNINAYNNQINRMVEMLRDFILMHYAESRSDTGFWKKINQSAKNNKKISEYLNISKNRLLNVHDIENVYGTTGSLYNWILVSMGHFSQQTAFEEISVGKRLFDAKEDEENLQNYIKSKNWVDSETLINFLSNK